MSYLTDLPTWQEVLKYFGLCLAAGSSVWGAANELQVKGADDRIRLTFAGRVAIAFTFAGLIISIASEDLQRRESDALRTAQTKTEAKRTNEIIQAGQLLTQLSLQWQFTSTNPELAGAMKAGQAAIRKNAKTSQGGSPEDPFELVEYEQAIRPLFSYIARIGDNAKRREARQFDTMNDTIAVLLPLDPVPNAVLSFGGIEAKTKWAKIPERKPLSLGFEAAQGMGGEESIPHVTPKFGLDGRSTYTIDWNLQPDVLDATVDRRAKTINPTAYLPRVLKVTIFYDIGELPFEQNNFAAPDAEVWTKDADKKPLAVSEWSDIKDMRLTVQVNGVEDATYSYLLKRVSKVRVLTKYEDEIDTACTMLEFEIQESS
jgi:hypothetical protein